LGKVSISSTRVQVDAHSDDSSSSEGCRAERWPLGSSISSASSLLLSSWMGIRSSTNIDIIIGDNEEASYLRN
jgi:hypothetical protein